MPLESDAQDLRALADAVVGAAQLARGVLAAFARKRNRAQLAILGLRPEARWRALLRKDDALTACVGADGGARAAKLARRLFRCHARCGAGIEISPNEERPRFLHVG